MFGSLMMLASGVLASSPSSASASATRWSSVRRSGNWARMRPAKRDVAQLDVDARLAGERLDDRQERVRGQRRRLVRVGVDELHQSLPEFGDRVAAEGIGDTQLAMAYAPPARHLLRAKDLADARYADQLDVDDMAAAAGLSRAHFSREFRRAFGEIAPRLPAHAPAGARRRAAADDRPHHRRHLLQRRALQSIGSFTTSFTRMFEKSPAAYRASFPPAVVAGRRAVVRRPRLRAPAAPPRRDRGCSTFREDSGAARV